MNETQASAAPSVASAPAAAAAAAAVVPPPPGPTSSAVAASSAQPQEAVDKKEIYTHEVLIFAWCFQRGQAPWLIYGMNWSVRPDQKFRLAIGSFVEEYNNKVLFHSHKIELFAGGDYSTERGNRKVCHPRPL